MSKLQMINRATVFLILFTMVSVSLGAAASTTLPATCQTAFESSVDVRKGATELTPSFQYRVVNGTQYPKGILYAVEGKITVKTSQDWKFTNTFQRMDRVIVTPNTTNISRIGVTLTYQYSHTLIFINLNHQDSIGFTIGASISNQLNTAAAIMTTMKLTAVNVNDLGYTVSGDKKSVTHNFQLEYSFTGTIFEQSDVPATTENTIDGTPLVFVGLTMMVAIVALVRKIRRN